MKIKTVKKMNLLELIQGVWEGDLKAGERKSDYGNTVFIWSQGLETYKGVRIQGDEVFTVEVEEEVTEDTEFCNVDVLIINKDTQELSLLNERYGSIKEFLYSESYVLKTLNIFAEIDDKKQLIYSADHGIPESGVLEVDTE